jgi:hypothetical protein
VAAEEDILEMAAMEENLQEQNLLQIIIAKIQKMVDVEPAVAAQVQE